MLEHSGVSVGSLYHHFGSFPGLAVALYNQCMGSLLDTLVVALEDTGGAHEGITATCVAYLRWVGANRAQAHFIFASPYSVLQPEHAASIAAAKEPRMAAMLAWLAPHVESGAIVALSPALVEMLLVGPLAETSRRWLASAPGIDLDDAATVLPERIWASLRRV